MRLGHESIERDADRLRNLIVGVIGARVYNDAAITIGTGAATALTFNSERFDSDTIHSTALNTSRLTATTPGVYLVFGHVEWIKDAGVGYRLLAIRWHDTSAATDTYIASTRSLPGTVNWQMSISTVYELDQDDYMELIVYQNTGGDLNIEVDGNLSPEFGMVRLW